MCSVKLLNIMLICLFVCGCDKARKADSMDIGEAHKELINVTERKKVKFFPINANFSIPAQTFMAIKDHAEELKVNHVENIAVLLISNKKLSVFEQENIKNAVFYVLRKQGFPESRIIFKGVSVYKEAAIGVRIDALKYSIDDIDFSKWDYSIGDIDVTKKMPRFGTAIAYNTSEMIYNKADLVSPREYKSQKTQDAITALATTSSDSSSSSSSSSSLSSSSSSSSSL